MTDIERAFLIGVTVGKRLPLATEVILETGINLKYLDKAGYKLNNLRSIYECPDNLQTSPPPGNLVMLTNLEKVL